MKIEKKFDVVIVGAGLAGLTVANGLAQEKNINVTLLEYGSSVKVYDDSKINIGDARNLSFTRGMGLGGTSNFWHSGLIRMPNSLEWVQQIDLDKYIDEALNEFGFDNCCKEKINTSIAYPKKIQKIELKSGVKSLCGVIVTAFDDSFIEYTHNNLVIKQKFDKLIICCGGIGSPDILLKCAKFPNLSQYPIGKNLTDHINSACARIRFKSIKLFKNRWQSKNFTFQNGIVYFDPVFKLHHICYLRPALNINIPKHSQRLKRLLIESRNIGLSTLIFEILKNFSLVLEVLLHKLAINIPSSIYSLTIVSEQEPINRVKVVNDNTVIDWKVSENEIRSLNRAIGFFVEYFGQELQEYNAFISKELITACCHHSGTCRISTDPSLGVVDNNLKAHFSDNVYVCDASVLPTTAYTNTGLTIKALALRLTKYISQQLC